MRKGSNVPPNIYILSRGVREDRQKSTPILFINVDEVYFRHPMQYRLLQSNICAQGWCHWESYACIGPTALSRKNEFGSRGMHGYNLMCPLFETSPQWNFASSCAWGMSIKSAVHAKTSFSPMPMYLSQSTYLRDRANLNLEDISWIDIFMMPWVQRIKRMGYCCTNIMFWENHY